MTWRGQYKDYTTNPQWPNQQDVLSPNDGYTKYHRCPNQPKPSTNWSATPCLSAPSGTLTIETPSAFDPNGATRRSEGSTPAPGRAGAELGSAELRRSSLLLRRQAATVPKIWEPMRRVKIERMQIHPPASIGWSGAEPKLGAGKSQAESGAVHSPFARGPS